MFLRRTERKKNGKAHSNWNVVENKRLDNGRVVQRHVLYLGEINSSQAAAWRKAIEVFDEDAGRSRTAGPVSGGSMRGGRGRCIRRSPPSARDAASPSAAMGRVLAGRGVVAGTRTRSVLGRSAAAEPQEDAVGSGSAGSRQLPADRSGKRMAAASRMVRQQRDG